MRVSNFNFQTDLSPIILWQYLEAEKLKSLVDFQQTFMNTAVRDFVRELETDFFNIATANTNGLALWGRLLNVGRPVIKNSDNTVTEFTDEQYRVVLRAKIYLLAFDGSAKALNQFFKMILPNLPIVITDNLDMTVSFNVLKEREELEPWERTLMDYFFTPFTDPEGNQSYSISLPRPSGVQYKLNYTIDYSETFGFEGQTFRNNNNEQEQLPGFDNGTFFQ